MHCMYCICTVFWAVFRYICTVSEYRKVEYEIENTTLLVATKFWHYNSYVAMVQQQK
jgi:hypothetical protein